MNKLTHDDREEAFAALELLELLAKDYLVVVDDDSVESVDDAIGTGDIEAASEVLASVIRRCSNGEV